MRIDSAVDNPSLTQGRPSTARLMAYLLFAGILMVLDQRGDFVPRIRAFAEQLVTPVYQVAEAPAEALRGISTYSRSYSTVVEQNDILREQLLGQQGDMQRLAALQEENRRLRALLDTTAGRNVTFRFAQLVQVSLDPYSHQVLIDRGADDGVFVGQAVIDGLGVMGQVESTRGGQARVRLISDPEHAIPVQILRTGQRTVALGTGEAGRLSLPNLPAQSDVREGDMLVTSGLGERFPAGFPVAEISRVDRETGEAFMSIDARPLAALDRGLEVLLVQPDPADPAPIEPGGSPGPDQADTSEALGPDAVDAETLPMEADADADAAPQVPPEDDEQAPGDVSGEPQ